MKFSFKNSEFIQNILSRYSPFKDFFIDVTCMTNLVDSIVVVVIKIPEYKLQADGIHMLQLHLENRQKGKSEIFHGLKYTL